MDSILRQGSKGSAVAELQQLLQSKGFYSGKIDGDFGAGTTNAVLKFQKENGLVPDGIVGSSSWAKLRVVVIPTSAQGLPTLLPGSKGAAVSQAQQLLKDKGYYQGRIDGDFGVGTRDAIADVTPPVTVVEIVRPSSPTPTPVTPSPTPTPSIFVPSPTISVTANNPSVSTPLPVPSASAISLVDAANSYSRARLPNQTAAINNLQASVTPEILQQFFQRWQIASGQATTSTSLQDALGGYNSAQMLNQNLALQWLQSQLLSQSLAQFRQDWSNLNAGTGTGTTTPFTPTQPTPPPTNNPQLQLINLTAAVKVYTRTANQLTALENLQASLPLQTMQQFFQRWALASGQTAIAISLVDVFQDYDSEKFSSQVTALQWLEKELTTANLEKFSKDWQTI